MNWGEIQIETLKKMYLNTDDLSTSDINSYKTDKKYKTYLFAMPQACNEAIRKILNAKPNIKSYTLKYKNNTKKYDLPKIIPNFKNIFQIVYNGNNLPNYYIEGNNILVINDWKNPNETFTIYYESYHNLIKSSTTAETSIDLDKECVALLPLYIAGELYKDDDIQQSTIWMNEFETALSEISNNQRESISTPNSIISTYEVDW